MPNELHDCPYGALLERIQVDISDSRMDMRNGFDNLTNRVGQLERALERAAGEKTADARWHGIIMWFIGLMASVGFFSGAAQAVKALETHAK